MLSHDHPRFADPDYDPYPQRLDDYDELEYWKGRNGESLDTLQTEDGEAWFWKFEGADLPVADNLAELLLAARQLLASRARTK